MYFLSTPSKGFIRKVTEEEFNNTPDEDKFLISKLK